MVVCLELGADLHMALLMPLPLTVSCSSKIQIGFTFLVPAYPGCPGKEAIKWLLLLFSCRRNKSAGDVRVVWWWWWCYSELLHAAYVLELHVARSVHRRPGRHRHSARVSARRDSTAARRLSTHRSALRPSQPRYCCILLQ